ncbi:MAG: High-affinity branched-chain amino acid transport ATP-binding protein LivF [Syntrophorhabdus sp. PtaU1.Bin153]|nr:MAG: High-affinity branched-chain amino acid transport ATP-binding protein LivF [Syntrophorhabdus sp. PtaU1.Bin153]
MLEISRLSLSYNTVPVLQNVSIKAQEGEIVSVIGPNGAGKSTLLKAIMNVADAVVEGSVMFNGESIQGMKTAEIIRRGLSYVPQGNAVFGSLTVEENLKVALALSAGSVRDDLGRVYQRFPVLETYRKKTASQISGGERQILGLARTLVSSHPRLLLLDEPSIGLSPKIAAEVFGRIEALRAEGTTVMLIEQRIQEAISVSDRVYILKSGKVFFEGTRHEIQRSEHLAKAYLGG